jgi:hypothetical protein
MRRIPLWNFPEFDRAASLLRCAGWQVYNPAEHDRDEGLDENDYPNLPDWFTLEAALAWDFGRIIAAGNICLLDGWEHSAGAAKELRVAEDIGAKVWKLHKDVFVEWDWGIVHEIRGGLAKVAGIHDSFKNVQWSTDPGPVVAIKTSEHRVIDPVTGGAKGQKDARLGALDAVALLELAKVGGMGEEKYSRFNYLKGYAWSLSIDALYRHLLAFQSGEDNDEESGLPHVAHAAWHALCLTSFVKRGLGSDDRFTPNA